MFSRGFEIYALSDLRKLLHKNKQQQQQQQLDLLGKAQTINIWINLCLYGKNKKIHENKYILLA